MDVCQNPEDDEPPEEQVLGKIPGSEAYKPTKEFSPFAPYRSLVADRLKLTGSGNWNIANHLSRDLWLPFVEPAILELPPRRCTGPNLKHEKLSENLKLVKLWDARGLLCLFHEKLLRCSRVFNAHKSDLVDRQIGDRRYRNQHEMHRSGLSSSLPSGANICSIHCPRGHALYGCISDRKDFYHQCQVSRSRAFSNSLPFGFDASLFDGSSAMSELLADVGRPTNRETHGDRYGLKRRRPLKRSDLHTVYAGFGSLYQGDHLGVEYALEGHTNLLRDSGLFTGDVQIVRNSVFPTGPEYQGLVIDGFFSIFS